MKKLLKAISLLVAVVLVAVVAYVGYVLASYYRIGDTVLDVEAHTANSLHAGDELTALSYNIGFGAYSPSFDFFMDGGTHAIALSQADATKNTDGAAMVAANEKADFIFIQEMDTDSTRSYHVNQYDAFKRALPDYDTLYASNFHSPYLFYPVHEPHGTVNSGIATFSRYALRETAERHELTVTDHLISKQFDLDRCFTVSRTAVGGDYLVLVNVHLSAYDESGIVRQAQLKQLEAFLLQERQNGSYVLMGGDFNHDLIATHGQKTSDFFVYDTSIPEEAWVQIFPDSFMAFLKENGFTFNYATNQPTCRSTKTTYTEGVTPVWVIDGFITSDNIDVVNTEVLKQNGENFLYSDHNPVKLTFRLKDMTQ